MTAGVHFSGGLGCVRRPRRLVDRQGVHICAQTDGLTRAAVAALYEANDAGAPDTGDDLVAAERLQFLGDGRGGAVNVKEQFRVFVNVAPPCSYLVMQVGEAVDRGHGSLLIRAAGRVPPAAPRNWRRRESRRR